MISVIVLGVIGLRHRLLIYSPLLRRSFLGTMFFWYYSIRSLFFGRSHGPFEVLRHIRILTGKSHSVLFVRGHRAFHKHVNSMNLIWIPDANLSELKSCCLEELYGSKVLFGPNVDLRDESTAQSLKQHPLWFLLVPSDWTKDFIASKYFLEKCNLLVWPSGISLDFWNPYFLGMKSQGNLRDTVLLYIKAEVSEDEFAAIKSFVDERDLRLKQIHYGDYSKPYFREILARSLFMIVCGSSESQGLSHFEAWSMNCPTLVRRTDEFIFEGESFACSASPYLSSSTGLFTEGLEVSKQDLHEFYQKLTQFRPRAWVIQDFSAGWTITQIFDQIEKQL